MKAKDSYTMSHNNIRREQDQNTAKLVMNAFYKVADKNGATASEITRYLQDKFGDVWRATTLTWKAEETLKRSAILGFLDRKGNRYVANLARDMGCGRKRRRKRRKSCKRRRRRKRACPRKKRRRRPSCCCDM
ncbi:unnamed protein product [Chrysodeixis includens]|uniref:H15 domain-containing protein n=1 Tax=Chrysodeixis includens TaxID=689277 RepID=A0A9P0BL80_CHRIL|nr:unnamed protein product [Chrysodeixis includens]